jgi:scyllo-inositol 2-dehydrogenase (NADP+)
MRNKIRSGIIGYGRSGQLLHGPGLRAWEDFEVAAVCDRSESSLDQAKKDFGCEVFTDYKQMLDQVELDLVIIITRSDQHCFMAVDCLNAGANVMVTKPMGITADEVREVKQAAEVNGRTAYPFLPSRWGSHFRGIRAIVESGKIGKVFCIRRSVFGFATRDDWQTVKKFGGGILLNWGPHLLDIPVEIAGGQPKSVFGSCSQLLNGGDAEDNYYSVVTMDNGVRVHSEWSFSPKGIPNWFIQGTQGCIIVNDRTMEITSGDPAKPGDPTDFKAMEGAGHQHEIDELGEHIYGDSIEIYGDLAKAIKGEGTFAVNVDDALRTAILIDSIKESQETETLIKL